MTDSDQPRPRKSPLASNVRKTKTLWASWIAIRSKAINSGNRRTREDANRIDQNPVAVLRGLQEALRGGTFRFELHKGVLQKRKGKDPRPIVVSPVTNRIVQRAILETLQTRNRKLRALLGDVPNVLSTPTSVGGIPGRGSKDAVDLIRSAISNGASHYVRSDIRNFFTKVPTAQLLSELERQTDDHEFVQLIREGLSVELSNADDPQVREWLSLFPDGETGVPQGSSLSAFCANYVLRDFDQALNGRGITTVRYIDDFVILGASERSVMKAWRAGERRLKALGLEAHQPVTGGSKASLGTVNEAFDFLSFRFGAAHVGISAAAKEKFKKSIRTEIRDAQQQIDKLAQQPRRAQAAYCQHLVGIDRLIRGWGDAFREADNRLEFAQLDNWVSVELSRFHSWYLSRVRNRSDEERRRMFGIALLADTPPPDFIDEDDEASRKNGRPFRFANADPRMDETHKPKWISPLPPG